MPYTLGDTPLVRLESVVGGLVEVPLLDGRTVHPINLDNAASTPALRPIQEKVNELLEWYSSVHRGTGFKSQLCTRLYEEAREVVGKFVGARPGQHITIFVKHTTEGINKLSKRLKFKPGDVVITSEIEHHANDLPWRQVAQVAYIRSLDDGSLDENHLRELLKKYAGRVRLIAVTGGSNVTGTLPNIHRIAELAHAAGAQISVDGAQLAPHRKIDLGDLNDPAHIDYVIFSGHKMYAPFGGGAIVGRADTFAEGAPDVVGGGTVASVTAESVEWTNGPDRDEAGSPNIIGAFALAAAVKVLENIGLDTVAEHEAHLTAHALRRLKEEVPNICIHGDEDPNNAHNRLGVVAFGLNGVDHRLIAAVLSYEYGIAVRAGSFCAQPYVRRLLDIECNAEVSCDADDADQPVKANGLVRISFGIYNTIADVDAVVDALVTIAKGEYKGSYSADPHGGFRPDSWQVNVLEYASIAPSFAPSL